jgi:formylglycine-generating enzyme required for sulfatase activity
MGGTLPRNREWKKQYGKPQKATMATPLAKVIVGSALALWLPSCETTGFVLDLVDSAGLGEPSDGSASPSPSRMSDSETGPDAIAVDAIGPEAGVVAPLEASVEGAAQPPSCVTSGPGTTNCGASENCCTSLVVTGGTYNRVYTNNGNGPTGLANPATVSTFRLDKYDVTVGRFRQFVNAWTAGESVPPAGSGKHSHLNDGQGLRNSAEPGTYEPGWVAADDANVAPTSANLTCDPEEATWTNSPGNNENLPINCVDWYEAYAFCTWDGGFLPSEAEWEYAAAGGSQEREYAWGIAAPGTDNRYAIYNAYYPNGMMDLLAIQNIAPVGTATLGAGLWGQLDLLGEIYQWTLDAYQVGYVDPCVDCAWLTADPTYTRVRRGGAFGYALSELSPTLRRDLGPKNQDANIGFRCARTPL